MKLKWHGHSCFELTLNNGLTVVTDPFDETVGYPLCAVGADVALTSHGHFDHNHVSSLKGSPRVLDSEGTWQIGEAAFTGVSAYHDPEKGRLRGSNIIFSVEADGMRVVHLGDLGHMPDTDAQKDIIRGCDILLIPIGGTYTITTPQAVDLIRNYAPKAAIAMHYQNRFCKFNITTCDEFIKATGAQALANTVDIVSGSLSGCFIMDI